MVIVAVSLATGSPSSETVTSRTTSRGSADGTATVISPVPASMANAPSSLPEVIA